MMAGLLTEQLIVSGHRRHLSAREYLRSIATLGEMESIINALCLTDREKQVARMYYENGHDYAFIADSLGYSESTIKRINNSILRKTASAL